MYEEAFTHTLQIRVAVRWQIVIADIYPRILDAVAALKADRPPVNLLILQERRQEIFFLLQLRPLIMQSSGRLFLS
jgi:hypothetical protein